MSAVPDGRSHRLLAVRSILLLAAAVVAVLLARAALFGHFSIYDDEGYMLLAIRAWREGGGLYDRIETIYGPVTFQVIVTVFTILRLPLDNSGAREFVLGVWSMSILLCALYVWRIHRSALAAALAAGFSFPILVVLAAEPLHAGDLLVLLLPATALVSLGFAAGTERRRTWALLGALTAAVALTKLNVGVLLALAVCATWLRFSQRNAWTGAARLIGAALLVAFPFLLMRPLLSKPRVEGFALLESAALLPFALYMILPSRTRPWSVASLFRGVLGGLTFAVVSLGICFATGTTPAGAWRSLVLDTLRFPSMISLGGPVLPPPALVAVALLLVPIVEVLRRSSRPGAGKALVLVRIAAAVFVLRECATFARPVATLPFLWLFALPSGPGREDAGREKRSAFLASMVTLQGLHVFPVPASQLGFFGFLVPVVAVVGAWDAWKDAAFRLRARARIADAWTLPALLAGILAFAFLSPQWQALFTRWRNYRDREVELGLPGTAGMRLPERQTANYRWLAANLRRHGDTFVSVPGRHSFYLWTGEESPVPFYSAWWPVVFDAARQRTLGEALLAHPKPCIVRVPGMITGWEQEGPILPTWVDEHFRPVGRVYAPGLELLIPKEAPADLVLTAFTVDAPGAARDGTNLRLALPEMSGVRLVRFSVVDPESAVVLCDSAASTESERMVLVDPPESNGRPLSILLDRRLDVLARCPARLDEHRSLQWIVRCYDDRGGIAAWLPVVR